MPRAYFVYILSNRSKTLYIGVTSNLHRRLAQHADGKGSQFVVEHRLKKLVHVESYPTPLEAIAREKQLKGWVRRRKVQLVEGNNPGWNDLRVEWGWRKGLESALVGRRVGESR